MAEAYLIK
ncbi:hypothetical protein N7465_010765 [Penicillium sp. CMV-2018d]|nr:hypothetical protein N7465_010765 [Penicillium sp. CMV-2018d]